MLLHVSPGDRISQPLPRGPNFSLQYGILFTGKLFSILHLLSTLDALRKYCTTYSMQGLFSLAPPLSPLKDETLEVHLQYCTALYRGTPVTLHCTVLRYTCKTAMYCTEGHLKHCTVLYLGTSATPHCTVLSYTCNTVLYCTEVHLQHCTVLY